jgi:DNA (cytosine-5)-methyltransferase 1
MDTYVAKYEKASSCINPRDLYADRPARTLTCRNLAGATGDMQRVKLKDGRSRRLLHNEAARLQSFPDWYEFIGNETQRFNQIGNAVPPLLAYQMALAVKDCFQMDELFSAEEIIENNLQPNQVLTLF